MSKTLAWGLGLPSFATAVAVLVACSAEPKYIEVDEEPADGGFERDGSVYDSAPPADSGLGELRFQPDQAYSGFDGAHEFTVPVAVYDSAPDLDVTVDDPSAATVAPKQLVEPVKDGIADSGKYYFVVVKKAGTISLTAKSGAKTAKMSISVASYGASRYAAGESRYAGGSTPCTDCHGGGAAIDHSPAALATSDDAKVAAVIKNGISTAGFPIQGVTGGHKWTVTTAELDGLVTYLRALPPRGFK